MKKTDILRNLTTTSIPVSLAIFGLGWLIFRNAIGAAVLPTVLFAASLYSNIGRYYDDIKREAAGVTKKKYKARKAYELLAPDDSVGPSLCIDIDDGKYLITNGQWIYDEAIYGEDAKEYYDEESDIFNGYHSPYSFPSTEFEIWVSNLDGSPSKIVVLGEYLSPKEVDWPTPEKHYKSSHAVITKCEIEKGIHNKALERDK